MGFIFLMGENSSRQVETHAYCYFRSALNRDFFDNESQFVRYEEIFCQTPPRFKKELSSLELRAIFSKAKRVFMKEKGLVADIEDPLFEHA